ncbi:MAG: ribonuclease P protein component [Candidatus Saccharimonadales bacterium]
MLAFKYRFHGHGSLRYVYAHGRAVRSRLITLKYSEHPKRKNPRVATVISKKVIKGAVGRNRVRRRVYEIVRQELPLLKENSDIVLIVFSAEVRELPAPELTSIIRELLKEADIYKK